MFNLDKFIYRVRNVVLFVTATTLCIPAPISAQTQIDRRLNACKSFVVELTGIPSSTISLRRRRELADPSRLRDTSSVGIYVTEPWKLPSGDTATDSIGYCEFDSNESIIEINTSIYSAQSPSDFQDFGEIPGIGRFIVIFRKSKFITGGRVDKSPTKIYYRTIGQDSSRETSVFPVIVNNQGQTWYANCNDKYIGRLSADGMRALPLAPKTWTEAVIKLVCAK